LDLSQIVDFDLSSLEIERQGGIVGIHNGVAQRSLIATGPDDDLCLLTETSVERLMIAAVGTDRKKPSERVGVRAAAEGG
jgi:hypothetical protein